MIDWTKPVETVEGRAVTLLQDREVIAEYGSRNPDTDGDYWFRINASGMLDMCGHDGAFQGKPCVRNVASDDYLLYFTAVDIDGDPLAALTPQMAALIRKIADTGDDREFMTADVELEVVNAAKVIVSMLPVIEQPVEPDVILARELVARRFRSMTDHSMISLQNTAGDQDIFVGSLHDAAEHIAAGMLDDSGIIAAIREAIDVGRGLAAVEPEPEDDDTDSMRQMLTMCRATFLDYEQQHLAKPVADTVKAARNRQMADRIQYVLAGGEPIVEQPDCLTITLTGPQGCGKTVIGDWLRVIVNNNRFPATEQLSALDAALRGKSVNIIVTSADS